MRIDYINTNFSILDRAVIDDKTYILGSDEILTGVVDLNMYGWKFFPSLSYEILEWLPLSQKPLNKTEAEIIRKTLIPTLSSDPLDNTINYYGSITSGSQKLYMLIVPKGSSLVKFFEGDSEKIRIDVAGERDNTLLWFVVAGKNVSDINLAYYSWLRSQVPHRNSKSHFIEGIEPIEVVERDGEFWTDLSSGTLLANTEITETPILNSIIKRFRNDKSWSHRIFYKRGDIVIFDNKEWIALEDNIGINPMISKSWIPKEIASTFMSKISIISCEHGETYPNIVPTPEGSRIFLESIKLDYGYTLPGYPRETYDAYVEGDLEVVEVEVEVEKSSNLLKVDTTLSNPLIHVYVNDQPLWPKMSASDVGITRDLRIPLGESFLSDSNLKVPYAIGEITNAKKSFITSEGEILGTSEDIDLVSISETDNTTISLADTINLPCDIVRYDISLTNNSITLTVKEYFGFYINTTQTTCANSETIKFYLKPIRPIETCSVNIYDSVTTPMTIVVSSTSPPGTAQRGSSTFKITRVSDELYELEVDRPTRNFEFYINGN